MKKIQGPKIASTNVSAPKAAEKATAAAKPAAATKAAATFPRTAWADPAKLAKSIETAHATETHPRLVHARPPKDPIGGEPTRPPIAMRYGLRPPNNPPPIAMRYGLRPPNPGQPTPPPVQPPPIAMRYGLRPPDSTPSLSKSAAEFLKSGGIISKAEALKLIAQAKKDGKVTDAEMGVLTKVLADYKLTDPANKVLKDFVGAPPPPPPIAMRYGLRPPIQPPIAMRYGLVMPQPRPGIPATPRPGRPID